MKTLLLWGVETTLAQHIAYQLSLDGHRLLVTGSDFDNLQELDVALCQSELHRFRAQVAPRAVADWVSQQHIGLDGAVLFPPAPEPGALLTPLTANLRRADHAVFGAIELLRELVPQLRRGKRPKRVLIVIAWDNVTPSPHISALVNLWQHLLGPLNGELEPDGVQVNVLHTSAEVPPLCRTPSASNPPPSGLDEEPPSNGRTPIVPCENAVFAARWFSVALSPLSGQFVQHPVRKDLRGPSA